ncbi:MAG: sulfotransferase [Burkholderiales bacterium]|nr:sulfotransferase [Opitutaceae bacterium]
MPTAFAPDSGWIRFHAAVLADETHLARLLATPDAAACHDTALALAAELGLTLAPEEITRAIANARHAWLLRHTAPIPPSATAPDAPRSPHWLPIQLHPGDASTCATVEWASFGDLALTDPFFEQSIGAALRHPARLLFRHHTSLDALAPLADTAPELAPAGFVFHVSRCGSTLVAQALAADPRHRVLSEPSPLDQLLTFDAANPLLTLAQRASRLRGVVHSYARRRRPEEERLFIKFDAWHTLHLPVIRAAFPATPWIFLHRDPVEVLVSQHRQRGYQFIPGMMDPRPFGITPEELPTLDFDTYTARILRAAFDAALVALATPGSPGLTVDYRNLRAALPGLLRAHFVVPDDETTRTALAAALPRHAKNPTLEFAADSEAKHREAGEPLRALAARWLDEPRRRLLARNA